MTAHPSEGTSTEVSRVIDAPREAVYRAFLDPDSVATWLPPDGMSGRMHRFDPQEGGEFRISLTYDDPADSPGGAGGKTTDVTDTNRGRFVTLVPNERIEQVVEFESDDPGFAGEMRIVVTLSAVDAGTEVMFRCEDIPSGIRPKDNEAGTRSSLEQLAALLEERTEDRGLCRPAPVGDSGLSGASPGNDLVPSRFMLAPDEGLTMEDDATTDDERAIRELVDTWLDATTAGDTATVLDLLTDDVVFLVPGQEPFGKDAFETASEEMQDVEIRGTSDIRELQVLGDWAYLRNHIEMTMMPSDGDSVRRSGHTLTILRKGTDGRWRLARDANLVTDDFTG